MMLKQRKPGMIWVVSAFFLGGLLAFMAVQGNHQPVQASVFPRGHLEIVRADGTTAAFQVEVATTSEQQELGLMYRTKLAPDAGMFFLWPHDQMISMWMKNTEIPLDMLFVERDGRIAKIIANAVPEDLTPLSSDAPLRAVIEIGGGEAARQKIEVGDRVLSSAFSQ
jgi:uncharacterized protein